VRFGELLGGSSRSHAAYIVNYRCHSAVSHTEGSFYQARPKAQRSTRLKLGNEYDVGFIVYFTRWSEATPVADKKNYYSCHEGIYFRQTWHAKLISSR
jgi:hypothetical protein